MFFLINLSRDLQLRGPKSCAFASQRSPNPHPSTCAMRSQQSARWLSRLSPIEAVARRAVCTTSPILKLAVCQRCLSPQMFLFKQPKLKPPRSAFRRYNECSYRIQFKIAPTTKCVRSLTEHSTQSAKHLHRTANLKFKKIARVCKVIRPLGMEKKLG